LKANDQDQPVAATDFPMCAQPFGNSAASYCSLLRFFAGGRLRYSMEKLQQFLEALTELSRKYGIGLNGSVTPYKMEQDDFERQYKETKEDEVEFI
jgi:hypothetical protein